MTRKQYNRKVRTLLTQFHKHNGTKCYNVNNASKPKWGKRILVGKHAGETLRSYEQAWEVFREILGFVEEV